jgi:hypothetical protein
MHGADDFEILIMNVPDRDDLIAEVFYKNTQVACVMENIGEFVIQIFPCPDEDFWELPFDKMLATLERAKKILHGEY